MKKTYILALAVASLLTTTSCEDFLTEDVRGQENLDTYFQTEAEADKFLTGCYQAITFDDWWQIDNFWNLCDMCTDDYWMGNTTQDQSGYISLAHYQGTGQENGTIANFWQYRYKGILKCNIAIERIPQANIADENKKNLLIAEAKFLRGYFYFELVKNFGGVPIVKGFVMPEEISGITRASEEDVWALVEQDFKDAAAVLPNRSKQAASETGHATKGAALGMLGKAYMYQGKYAEAKTCLKQVIDSGEYQLMENFGDIWDVDHNNNKESIFEVQAIYDETYALGSFRSIISGPRDVSDQDGWAWGLPTANLEAAFKEAGDDIRLKWTIIKNGATEIAGEDNFAELVEAQGNKNGDGTYCIPPKSHKSARISRKIFIPYAKRPEKFEKGRIPLGQRILRYADVLLLYAEACNETGDDATARKYLNEVRNRVKLPGVTTSGNDLRQDIRKERRLELALEGHRLDDLRRWKEDGEPLIAKIMGPNGSFVKWNTDPATRDSYEWDNQKEASDKGISFDKSRDLLFPIPLYEITMSNGTITQHPGWK